MILFEVNLNRFIRPAIGMCWNGRLGDASFINIDNSKPPVAIIIKFISCYWYLEPLPSQLYLSKNFGTLNFLEPDFVFSINSCQLLWSKLLCRKLIHKMSRSRLETKANLISKCDRICQIINMFLFQISWFSVVDLFEDKFWSSLYNRLKVIIIQIREIFMADPSTKWMTTTNYAAYGSVRHASILDVAFYLILKPHLYDELISLVFS